MKSLRSQSLSDLDAEPPRVGVFELYPADGGIPKETRFLKWSEVTTKGQGLAGRLLQFYPAFILAGKIIRFWQVAMPNNYSLASLFGLARRPQVRRV